MSARSWRRSTIPTRLGAFQAEHGAGFGRHLGETLPYLLWRFDSRAKLYGVTLGRRPSEYIRDNMVVTLSGMFSADRSHARLPRSVVSGLCSSPTTPSKSSEEAGRFMDTVPLDDAIRSDIAFNNAARLLKL